MRLFTVKNFNLIHETPKPQNDKRDKARMDVRMKAQFETHPREANRR
jgi:hypothetical protein